VCVRDDLEGKAPIKVVVIHTRCHEVAVPTLSVDEAPTSCNAVPVCTQSVPEPRSCPQAATKPPTDGHQTKPAQGRSRDLPNRSRWATPAYFR
jgi:hypothetical protein